MLEPETRKHVPLLPRIKLSIFILPDTISDRLSDLFTVKQVSNVFVTLPQLLELCCA